MLNYSNVYGNKEWRKNEKIEEKKWWVASHESKDKEFDRYR